MSLSLYTDIYLSFGCISNVELSKLMVMMEKTTQLWLDQVSAPGRDTIHPGATKQKDKEALAVHWRVEEHANTDNGNEQKKPQNKRRET